MNAAEVERIVTKYWLNDEAIRNYFRQMMLQIEHENRDVMHDPQFAVAFISGLIYGQMRATGDKYAPKDARLIAAVVSRVIGDLTLTPFTGGGSKN